MLRTVNAQWVRRRAYRSGKEWYMQTIRGEMRREVDRQLDCWLDHVIKDNVLPLAASRQSLGDAQ
jgi:hypothetical protein